jgi:hypothetical protein
MSDEGFCTDRVFNKILLNDLDVSCSHMERLTKDLLGHQTITQLFLDAGQPHVKRVVSSLTGSVTKFRSALRVRA